MAAASQATALIRSLLPGAGGLWQRSGDELLALLRELETLTRLATAAMAEVTAEVDRRGLAADHGCTSTAGLLRSVLRLSASQAAEQVRVAAAVTETVDPDGNSMPAGLPATAAAWRTGLVGMGQVRVIAATMAALPADLDPDVRERAEALLAEQAAHLNPDQLRRVAVHLRARLDQDGLFRDEHDAVERREVHFARDHHGMIVLKGRLDVEGAAVLRTALDPLAAPRPATADGPDTRSPARRRADALVELAGRALAGGELPDSGGQRPQITVTLDYHQLRDSLGGGELDAGGPITATTARRLACDARVIPVVLGSRGEPLDVGRAAATVPAPMRRALIARDQGCAFPGCDRPPGWCEAHHIQHWAHGGPTAVDNLVLLCGAHHRSIHHHDWQVRITNGRPEFVPPPWVDPQRRPRRNTTPRDLAHPDNPPDRAHHRRE
jgi:hypothetical protein